ncbi:MAG: hypothetical protein HY205_05690 [Nitrospirae bacterium]|nr:hypothetical protein [Nitrospirota bacterium]
MSRPAPILSAFVAVVILLLTHLLLLLHLEPALTWFYPLVWWSYIFIVDGFVFRRKGRSLIWASGRQIDGRFWLMALGSAVIWLIFEAFNLRLENWWYHDVPPLRLIRWTGTIISFATVIPLLAETERLLNSFRCFDRATATGIRITPGLLLASQAAGALMLLACLLVPRYAFPLVWGGFALLIDPINYRAGAPSLLRDWETNHPGRTYRLLTAGLIAGLLWELWNFWAVARWTYTVPFVGEWKLFEMPMLGFLGFPPFALEAFVLYQLFCRPWNASIWPRPSANAPMRRPSRALTLLAIMLVLLFCVIVLLAIDRHTILSFADGSTRQ